MRTLCVKYFRHINQIIQIMQPSLSPRSKHSKSQFHMEISSRLQSEQHLQQQLESLKENVQNILKYCNKLENQNKILKITVPSSMQILEQNSYVIGYQDCAFENGSIFSNYDMNEKDSFQLTHRQKQQLKKYKLELKKTRQLYLDSLNKIQLLKSEISNLHNNLNHMNSISNNYQLDTSLNISSNFMPSNNKSQSKANFNASNFQIDIETLLCHQDLHIEDSLMKENNLQRANRDQDIVESLISKGIQFRQQRTLRSDQFKSLSTIVEKYREESMSHSKELANAKNNKSLYR